MKKIIILSFLLIATLQLPAQIIESIEKEISDNSTTKSSNNNSSSDNSSSTETYADAVWAEIMFDVFLFVGRVLIITPPEYKNLKSAELGGIDLSPYPYANGSKGGRYLKRGIKGKRFQVALNAAYQNHQGSLNSFYGSAELYAHPIFSVQIEHLRYLENRLEGNSDKLNLTNIHANWNRVMHPNFHLEYGFGISNMEGEETYSSLGLHIGSTVYLSRPVSIHTRWVFSSFENTLVRQGQLQAAYHYNRMNIHGGIHFLQVGDVNIISPKVGIGVVF